MFVADDRLAGKAVELEELAEVVSGVLDRRLEGGVLEVAQVDQRPDALGRLRAASTAAATWSKPSPVMVPEIRTATT